jgi:NTE family protein
MSEERSRTALILTGGGIMGAAYEIGSLTALDRLFLPGFSTRRFDTFIGISAGAVIATLVANRIQPAGLYRTISRNENTVFNWRRSDIYRFDWWTSLRSFLKIPVNLAGVFRNYRRNHWHFSLDDLPHLIQEQFPAGLFALDPMQEYLCTSFRDEGICDDFHQLKPELLIPAYDLDTGERVVFGAPGERSLHICQAITASCAIPFFFQPYRIGSRAFLDGSTGRVIHIDLAIKSGASLIVIINPRVPFHNSPDRTCLPSLSSGNCSQVDELGIMLSWEQARRIEARDKLQMALVHYRNTHPEVDILLLEPGTDEALFFLQGPMSITARTQVMQQGYHLTVAELHKAFDHYQELFNRHGIAVSRDRIDALPPS